MIVKLIAKSAKNDPKSPENLQGAGGINSEENPEIMEVEFITGLKFDRILGANNSFIKVNTGIS